MAFTRSQQQQQAISKKRRREQEHMEMDGNKKHLSDNGGIHELPDHLLIIILSRVGLKEAARTSVLAHRWRYLWRSAHEILRFGNRDTATGEFMEREKFDSWVDTVLTLQKTRPFKARNVEGVVLRLEEERELCWTEKIVRDLYWVDSKMYDSWVYFAMRKQVGTFELSLLYYDRYTFPSVARLISRSHGVSCRLRTFRLTNVCIEAKVVHYFLASCPNLEELSIHRSTISENLQVIDPPRLKVLEISRCYRLRKLEISAATLVSLIYRGLGQSLLMKKVPNLREISICDCLCTSFILDPKKHLDYSVQLEKLVMDFRFRGCKTLYYYPTLPQDHLRSLKRLEVFVVPQITLLVFTLLIKKACPQLREFRIEISYSDCSIDWQSDFPGPHHLPPPLDNSGYMDFVHMNLKLVEIGGYRGGRGEEELVLGLIETCPSLERVVIDTEIDYLDLPYYTSHQRAGKRVLPPAFFERQTEGARNRAKERAKRFSSEIPQQIKFVVT